MHRTIKAMIVVLALTVSTAGVFAVPLSAAEPSATREGSEYRMNPERHAGRERGMHGFVARSLHHLMDHAKDLGLSEEQTNKVKSIGQEFAKTHIRREADWKTAEVDVQTLIHDEKSELSAIEKAMRKAADAEIAVRLEGVKAFRAAKSVLTSEQQEKWRGLLRSSHGERAKKAASDDMYEAETGKTEEKMRAGEGK